MKRARWCIGVLVGVCLGTNITVAQNADPPLAVDNDKEAEYFPLFSETMIGNASAAQAARMRKSEADNRERFDARQRARREQQAQPKQAAEVNASQSEPQQEKVPAPSEKRNKSKIYKWVDANGRVHFGDAPQGNKATEVTVGGGARIQGSPPPAPRILKKAEK